MIVLAETQVLERSIVFVNNSKICALPITYINIYQHLKILPDCDVGGVSSGAITHIAINVAEDAIYFTVDTIIYRQQFYQTASSIYTASSQITGIHLKFIKYNNFSITYVHAFKIL